MLTRLKLKRGEGKLVGSPKVGLRGRRARFRQYPKPVKPQVIVETSEIMSHEGEPKNMTEDEKAFRKVFFDVTDRVKVLYEERNTRFQGESSKPPPSLPSASYSSSQASSPSSTNTTLTHTHYRSSKGTRKSHFLKLDVKFELPMYNGDMNAEKLDNWIHQLEVYCRIQNLQEDEIKIQLASLRMEGATLVWWESKNQEEIKKHGKLSISCNDFIATIKRKFYPLAYMQKSIMNWKNFR